MIDYNALANTGTEYLLRVLALCMYFVCVSIGERTDIGERRDISGRSFATAAA